MAEKKQEFECIYCKESFDDESKYFFHRDNIFCMCEYCGEIFKGSTQINEHLYEHYNDGIFMCFMCKVTTNDMKVMIDHISLHQKALFKCIKCKDKFLSKPSLLDHIYKHNYHWECHDCSFTTKTKKDFKEHKKQHEKSKRFYSIDEFKPIGIQLRTRDKNETIFISKQYY